MVKRLAVVCFFSWMLALLGLGRAFALEGELPSQRGVGIKSLGNLVMEVVGPEVTYILCQTGNKVRTLRVEKKSNYCLGYYTKNGVDKLIGNFSSPRLCQKAILGIKRKLEGVNWKCRDISAALITTSPE